MTAAAVLLLATVATMTDAAGARCPALAGAARMHLATADAAIARRAPRAANAALDEALATLGTAYRQPSMRDDTGMHLAFARSQARDGRPGHAATLKRAVLLERLHLCGALPS